MATQYAFGKIVTNGLVFSLDAADRNSYVSGSTVWRNLASTTPLSASFENGITFINTNGGSLTFSSASLQYATASSISGTLSNFTVGCWFYLTSSILNFHFPALVNEDLSAVSNYYMGSGTTEGATLKFGFIDEFEGNNFTSGIPYTSSVWTCAIGTYDGSSLKLYINGVLRRSGSIIGASAPTSSNRGIRIAQDGILGDSTDPTSYINGQIPIVQIYNRALSADEILQNYNAQKSRFGR